MFDWSFYPPLVTDEARPAWVPSRTFYVTRYGSHAYGTNIETSDEDFRGVCVAPREHYLGYKRAFRPNTFEDVTINKPVDLVVFEMRKFLLLCGSNNPNALELLFTDPKDHLLVTPIAEELLANRNMFLSRLAKQTFGGYARSQMHRIKLHYEWLHGKAPTHPPTRSEFGLTEPLEIKKEQMDAALATVAKKLGQWNLTGLNTVSPAARIALQETMAEMLAEASISTDELWYGAARTLGFSENFIDLVGREKKYRAAVKHWHDYQDWLRDRNPARAALEAKYGYDVKHGMHLVRLLDEAIELLTYGTLTVFRLDAEKLVSIRRGAWSKDQMIEWAEAQMARLLVLAETSVLPDEPDYEKIDSLCVRLVEMSFSYP